MYRWRTLQGRHGPGKTADRKLKFLFQVTSKVNLNPESNILIVQVTRVLQQLTNHVLVMLRDELFPVALSWRGKVDVDEAVARGV